MKFELFIARLQIFDLFLPNFEIALDDNSV